MAGLRFRLFSKYGAVFIHPDGDEVCSTFHAKGEKCPCDHWEYLGVGALPDGYFLDKFLGLVETGYILTYQGKNYEVLSVG